MGGFVAAWLVGEGIIIYRAVRQTKSPPPPGQLLASSAIFVMLGILAESQQARTLATVLAWGFDAAALMNLFPQITGGGTGAPGQKTAPLPGGAPPPGRSATA